MGKLLEEERFKHVDLHHTDVKKTFARIRRQLADEKEQAEAASKAKPKVVQLSNKGK